jgi:hypothetical protein
LCGGTEEILEIPQLGQSDCGLGMNKVLGVIFDAFTMENVIMILVVVLNYSVV